MDAPDCAAKFTALTAETPHDPTPLNPKALKTVSRLYAERGREFNTNASAPTEQPTAMRTEEFTTEEITEQTRGFAESGKEREPQKPTVE